MELINKILLFLTIGANCLQAMDLPLPQKEKETAPTILPSKNSVLVDLCKALAPQNQPAITKEEPSLSGQKKRKSDCADQKASASSEALPAKVPAAALDSENPLIMLSDAAERKSQFPCHDCRAYETNVANLKLHIISKHTKLKPYKCKDADCKNEYKEAKGLQYHLRVKHSSDTPATLSLEEQKELNEILKPFFIQLGWRFLCSDCNGLFPTDISRQSHLNTAHKEISQQKPAQSPRVVIKKNQCPMCKKECANQEAYIQHVGEHISTQSK